MKRTFAGHWKDNFALGARRAWDWMGIRGIIVDVIIAVTAGIVLGQNDIAQIGLISILVALAIYVLISLVFAVFIVPFQKDIKQGN